MANILRKQGHNVGGCDTSNVEKNIEAIVNVYGAKNLLVYPYYETTKTVSGITFTDNGNGTITANGTASANTNFYLQTDASINDFILLKAGSYIVSLTNALPVGTMFWIESYGGQFSLTITEGQNNKSFVLSQDTYIRTRFRVANGTTLSNYTFKPMIRDARISDDTYVPYTMTNRELTEKSIKIYRGNFAQTVTAGTQDFRSKTMSDSPIPTDATIISTVLWSNNLTLAGGMMVTGIYDSTTKNLWYSWLSKNTVQDCSIGYLISYI